MSGIEWGILPITETWETGTDERIVTLNIDRYFFRAVDAAGSVLDSFMWEDLRE